MLLCDCGLWSLLLSLSDMSLFKFIIHYVESYTGTGYLSVWCYIVTRSPRHFEESKLC
jgi:hypothetical protein